MRIKTKCYFCNQKELEVDIPDDFDPKLGAGPENIFGVHCDCWKQYPYINFANTAYWYDGEYDYTINIKLKNQLFFFFYDSIRNITKFDVEDEELRTSSLLATFPGHLVTLENCYEKLQKYMPFI